MSAKATTTNLRFVASSITLLSFLYPELSCGANSPKAISKQNAAKATKSATPIAKTQPMVISGDNLILMKVANRYRKVTNLVKQNQLELAEAEVSQLAKEYPDVLDIQILFADVLGMEGKNEDEYQLLKRLAELSPTNFRVVIRLAESALHAGQLTEALDNYKKALELTKEPKTLRDIRDRIEGINDNVKQAAKYESNSPQGTYLGYVTKNNLVRRWTKENMPLKVFIDEHTKLPYLRPEHIASIKDAFADWEALSDKTVSFIYVKDLPVADIEVNFVSNRASLHSESRSSETRCQDSTERREHASITMLLDPNTKTDYMKRTFQHEIGHATGLTDHSPNASDIMFVTPYGPECKISARDIATLKALYQLPYNCPQAAIDAAQQSGLSDTKNNVLAKAINLCNEGIAIRKENPQAAVAKIREAVRLQPNYLEFHAKFGAVLTLLANSQYNNGQFKEAYTTVNEALKELALSGNQADLIKGVNQLKADIKSRGHL